MDRSQFMPMTEVSSSEKACGDGVTRTVEVQAFMYREKFGLIVWAVPSDGYGAVMFMMPENSAVTDSGMLEVKQFLPDLVYRNVYTPIDVLGEMMVQALWNDRVATVFKEADKYIDSCD